MIDIGSPGSIARHCADLASNGHRFAQPFVLFAYASDGIVVRAVQSTRDGAASFQRPDEQSAVVDVRTYGIAVGCRAQEGDAS